MRRLGLGALLIALAGCGYSAAPQTSVSAPAYKTDLEACHKASEETVNKTNAKSALTWFAGPVRRWSQIGDATGTCMDAKGYGRLRRCTSDELANSRRSGNVVVTAAGVQCADPPKR